MGAGRAVQVVTVMVVTVMVVVMVAPATQVF